MAVRDWVTLTAAVRLRFSATDNPNNSVTEAAVDAFKITSLQCGMPFGDGDFDLDGDVDLADFAAFQGCFEQPAEDGCAPGDLNGDLVVAANDFALFCGALDQDGPR